MPVMPNPRMQWFDDNGDPLAAGKLYAYQAGTSTPQDIYSDEGLTIPLANPITLDAAGRAPQIYIAQAAYKFVLKNALGATVWTSDNVRTPQVGDYQSYTPVWASVGGTPVSLGDGVIEGQYHEVGDDGIEGDILLTFGSTSSAGAGNTWTFSLPVPAINTKFGAFEAYILDYGAQNYSATGVLLTASTMLLIRSDSAGDGTVGAGAPHVWAVNDQVKISFRYRRA